MVLAALQEEEELDSITNSNKEEEIANVADESNAEGGDEEYDSNSAEPPLEKSKKAENPPASPALPATSINHNLLFFLTDDLKLPLTCHESKAGHFGSL